MTVVTISEDGPRLILESPYDADVIARIKDVVPGHERQWDASRKRWMVTSKWGSELTDSLIAGGHSVRGKGERPTMPRDNPASASPPPSGPKSPGEPGSFWSSAEERAWAKAKAAEIIESVPEHLRPRVLREYAKLVFPDMYSG